MREAPISAILLVFSFFLLLCTDNPPKACALLWQIIQRCDWAVDEGLKKNLPARYGHTGIPKYYKVMVLNYKGDSEFVKGASC